MKREYELPSIPLEAFQTDLFVAREVAKQRRRFVWWLALLPITIPLTLLYVLLACSTTIDAIIRLVHHQY